MRILNLITCWISMWSIVIGSTMSAGNSTISIFHMNRSQTDNERRIRCILPTRIVKGSWEIFPNSQPDYQPGDMVPAGIIIQIKCDNGYAVSGAEEESTFSLCNGNMGWTIDKPECVRICQPVNSLSTVSVICTKNGRPTSCKVPTEGTRARFTCPLFYELSTTNNLGVCIDGTWDIEKPRCEPVCGMKTAVPKHLMIEGQKNRKEFYPWSIAIYKKYNDSTFLQICSGSLISERIILTAAHCVSTPQGVKMNEKLFMVAAGKYFREYNHPNETIAQYSEVEEIYVYNRYRGVTLHLVGDIAIIVTKKPFNTTQFVRRICIDWDPNSSYEHKLPNRNGVVAGWGNTEGDFKAVGFIKEIIVPYIDFDQCYDETPDHFKTFVREDKICGGNRGKGVGVNSGDGGAGLAFKEPDGNNRFYLRGILSNAPQVDGGVFGYALYTKVSTYIRFIMPIFNRYKIENY